MFDTRTFCPLYRREFVFILPFVRVRRKVCVEEHERVSGLHSFVHAPRVLCGRGGVRGWRRGEVRFFLLACAQPGAVTCTRPWRTSSPRTRRWRVGALPLLFLVPRSSFLVPLLPRFVGIVRHDTVSHGICTVLADSSRSEEECYKRSLELQGLP